jgi:hypothetical protein
VRDRLGRGILLRAIIGRGVRGGTSRDGMDMDRPGSGDGYRLTWADMVLRKGADGWMCYANDVMILLTLRFTIDVFHVFSVDIS